MIFKKINFQPSVLILLCLFSCALLIHIGNGYPKATALIALLTGLQFINFKLWWPTLFTILIFLSTELIKFPRIPNHANLEIFISLIIIFFICLLLSGKKTKYITAENLPLIFRYSLITIYFIAGFHKLNSGFFDVDGSCITHIGKELNQLVFGRDFILSQNTALFFKVATLIIEMIVPFGLLFYNTRKATAYLLVVFHIYLSLCGFANFSSLAGFFLAGCILDFSNANLQSVILKGLRWYLFFTIISCVAIHVASRLKILDDNMELRFLNGIIFNIGWSYFFIKLLNNSPFIKAKYSPLLIPVMASLVISLWGMQCYIGLSSAGNLSMFSNLITEKSRQNHYIVNSDITKIWDFEEDFVTILELPENLKWQGILDLKGCDLPLIEFKVQAERWLTEDSKTIKCKLLYKGEVVQIDDLRNSEFGKAKWWYKYLLYRKIPAKNECLW